MNYREWEYAKQKEWADLRAERYAAYENSRQARRGEPLRQAGPEQGYVHTKVESETMSETEWYATSKKREDDLMSESYGLLTDPELIAANNRLNGTEGIKHDEGKERWDLLPPSIEHVVEVYTIGARKYADDNWAKGMGYRRIFGAMMRHAWKWFWGETHDPQDGQHHLASVAWACLTLMHYEDEGVGKDDRAFKPLGQPEPVYEAKPYGVTMTIGGNEAEAWLAAQESQPEPPPAGEPRECSWPDAWDDDGTFGCPVHGWH